MEQAQPESVKRSVALFEEAARLDQFALAHAGLADAYSILGTYSYLPPSRRIRKPRKPLPKPSKSMTVSPIPTPRWVAPRRSTIGNGAAPKRTSNARSN